MTYPLNIQVCILSPGKLSRNFNDHSETDENSAGLRPGACTAATGVGPTTSSDKPFERGSQGLRINGEQMGGEDKVLGCVRGSSKCWGNRVF